MSGGMGGLEVIVYQLELCSIFGNSLKVTIQFLVI